MANKDQARDDIGRQEHDNQTVGQTVRFDPHGDPENPVPTAEDPYDSAVEGEEIPTRREERIRREQREDPTSEKGPTYERPMEHPEKNPSGSTDPNNSLSEADHESPRIYKQE